MRQIQSYLRKAIEDYEMIACGDKIAVGLSGGKDSMSLLLGLASMRRFYPKKFDLHAITIDLGHPEGASFDEVQKLCDKLEVPITIVKTDFNEIIFDIRKEKNPCSLCAKMRRGALNDFAVQNGCNKVALGHHYDDAVETLMLSLFYEGRLGSFSPVTYMSKADITQIRPLIYAPEQFIRSFVSRHELPIYSNPCCANGNTKRQYIKELLLNLESEMPGLRERIFGALNRSGLDNWRRPIPGRKIHEEAE